MIGPQKPGRNRGYDPSNNNAPLQFDANKGKPPMPLEGKSIVSHIALQKCVYAVKFFLQTCSKFLFETGAHLKFEGII